MDADPNNDRPLSGPASYRYDENLPAESKMLQDLLKQAGMQELFESFYNLLKIPVAIIDFNANVLFSSRWQRICTLFHRVHPVTCSRCVESDRYLATQLDEGKPYTIYACKNGLTDCAAPILIDGKKVANVLIGQFLTQKPDEQWFRQQAQEFGFDVKDYIAALREVPLVEPARVPLILDLLIRMTGLITNLAVERKRAVEGQARQAIILDTIPQSVFWKDVGGKYLGCNAQFAKVAGLTRPDDIVGKTDNELPWPPREAAAYRADDSAIVASNRPRLHIEEVVQRADGKRIVADTSKVPLMDAGNRPYGVLGVFDDITERKRQEQALAESERKYRELVENANSIILRWRRDGRITFMNEFGLRFFGYTESELVGRSLIGTIVPEVESTGRDLQHLMERIRADPRAFEQNVNENVRRNGEHVWISWTNKVVLDEHGDVIELLSIGSDITEHLRAEEQVKSAYARATKNLDDAVATIAKIVEMRDPYTAGHQQRVAFLAVAIAREMNLEPSLIEQLRMAATIHDIGKINVPSDVLSKPGKLSTLEMQMIMTHAQSGYDIVKNMNFLPEVAQTILQHHERLDGSGYPNKLKGEEIRLEARILAVADVVEAMASHRPYRPALGIGAALAEISKNSGKWYDSQVVEACLRLFREKAFQFNSERLAEALSQAPDLKPPINIRAGT